MGMMSAHVMVERGGYEREMRKSGNFEMKRKKQER
jgi:hypothetical protein